jgi:carbon-monoxide dehydrogenase large subunit
MGCFEPEFMVEDVGGPKAVRTKISLLAQDRVRYVGERVAVVIADTEAQARDAAELALVKYEVLPAVVDIANAMRPGAPVVHEDIRDNVLFTMSMGNASATAQAFIRAHHVTKLSLRNNRVTAVSMEPRGCVADFDRGTGRYTLYTSVQAVHSVRPTFARQILHVPESRIRVMLATSAAGSA